MSEATDELKLAVMIGVTIALVFKTLDFFSRFLSKMLVEMWEEAPDFAIELMAFVIVLIAFIILLLIYIVRSGK